MEGVSCDLYFSDSSQSLFLGSPLKDFDVVAISVTYEDHIFTISEILKKAGIPPLRTLREEEGGDFPIIFGGGIGLYYNPVPFMPIFDAIYLGEAEGRIEKLFEKFREKGFSAFYDFDNVIVSKDYDFLYNEENRLTEIVGEKRKIFRSPYFPEYPSHSCFLTEDTAFKDMFLIELNRGCIEKCRFCVATYMGLPYREKQIEIVENEIALAAKYGERVGLIGAGVTDYSKMEDLYEILKKYDMKASFSSLKASSPSPYVLEIVKESGQKTVTIAPETGNEKLRYAINKKVPDEKYFSFTEELFKAGAENLKLYFLIGLPTETQEDVESIVKMTKQFYSLVLPFWKERGKAGEIHVSVNPVIPKPFTPLQWFGMEKKSSIEKKIRYLQKELRKIPHTRLTHENVRSAILQAIISRADTIVGEAAVISAMKKTPFRKVLKEKNVNFEELYTREREKDELFPWEIVESGIRRNYLWKEYQMIYEGKSSPSCFPGCKMCGLCD
ncbi:radical SAM protein [Desulfurobacterium pacificum]|uniref:radical SAM protein n=1 Tax=Desulfurobacterium pacificum TaxID=240166 RepID=UPI0024B6679E|nr:radical SAM protein [Desulfurobacterium pacificum]